MRVGRRFANQRLDEIGSFFILMTFGLVPITSMSLPFISYGFMPTLLVVLAVGLALSVYRRKKQYIDVK